MESEALKISDYRKKIMEQQIKLNNKDRLILEQRNIVLEKQMRIEDLESELHELKMKYAKPEQEYLGSPLCGMNTTIKLVEKKECGDCRREDRRMYSTPGYKCEDENCCNYK
jgi:hypothetical protein